MKITVEMTVDEYDEYRAYQRKEDRKQSEDAEAFLAIIEKHRELCLQITDGYNPFETGAMRIENETMLGHAHEAATYWLQENDLPF